MNVVIVESAAKAKTINKYLGASYKVLASYGHVRDLPSKDGSVEPDKDFAMHWDVEPRSAKVMREITQAVKGADKLILATDPDREGEAISWHILNMLEEKKALKGVEVERVTFNAVTKQAVLDAMRHPRHIEGPLVSAYLARRALDYLVGFTLSPVLWRKLPGARSAGRVQSVALRLICDREAEIEAFRTDEYWTIEADLKTARNEDVRARLQAIDGKALKKLDIKDAASANAIKAAIEGGRFAVASVDKKAVRRNPYAPFTTSTLQQEASRKHGFSASRTMQIAQKLYEGVDIGGETAGLITYMRTDGVQMAPEAIEQIRREIGDAYGKRYVPAAPREYKSKAKNAQEAHEAIRPTDVKRRPADIRKYLADDEAKLYMLVWQRAVASQMASAELEQTTADIATKGRDGKSYNLRATGSVVLFDGFLKLYEEGRDDDDDEDGRRLPPLAVGDDLKVQNIDAKQHFTEPPPRYSEATLVKKMEELGIGRPSTYASTLAVLRDREYVRLDKKRLVPEDKGRLVTAFLASFFKRYVEYDFTAALEEKLDLISDDKLEWKDVLREFWRDFMGNVDEIKDLRVSEVLDALNEILGPHVFPDKGDGSDPRRCPACGEGRLSLKISGKFGAFIGCGNYPECRYTRQLSQSADEAQTATTDGKVLGEDPVTGLPVTVRNGRFGPYLQIGETADGEKPKRASIPKPYDPATIELEMALKLLNLPREVGEMDGAPITAGIGRYGPFVAHSGTYANLESIEDVFTIGNNRAVELITAKREGKAGFGRKSFGASARQVLKDLGEHPSDGGKIQVLNGRYGPYINWGKVNANVPKSTKPEEVTLDQAVSLLAEREAKGPGKKPARGKAAAARGGKRAKGASAAETVDE
jgi:DNA topoisomerase-1